MNGPIPDMLEWWIPLGVAIPVCLFFLWKAWRYRETYHRWLIAIHFLYLAWCVTRGVGAILASSYLDNARYWGRVGFLLFATFLVLSAYHQAKRRLRDRQSRESRMTGPDEALWSPEPIVGFRWSIHSMHEETYSGQRAFCRHGADYHSTAEVPMWGCRCGYYAMKHWGEMGAVMVVVAFMWGRVIEHEWGYRSEYMRPIGYLCAEGEYLDVYPEVLGDHAYYEGFARLPVVSDEKHLTAFIEKARKSFDPAAPPPYDGGYYGYRTASTED